MSYFQVGECGWAPLCTESDKEMDQIKGDP